MSKNVTIQENGVGYDLALDVLRVPVFGGSSVDLIPADDRNLVKLVVQQNGTYKASEFKAYGISEIKVKCTRTPDNPAWEDVVKEIKSDCQPFIKEGGRSRVFSAKRIAVPLTAGGNCLWVLKNAVSVGTKSVSQDNKTYKASDDGLYGYSEVVVSGINITKTTDQSGNEVVTHEDGSGTFTEIVPSTIAITRNPTKTSYHYGEFLDYSGIVVHAYSADGTDMGEVPFEELIFPKTKAESDLWTNGNGINAKMIYYTPHWNRNVWVVGIPGHPAGSVDEDQLYVCSEEALGVFDGRPSTYVGDGPGTLLVTRYNGSNYMASLVGNNRANCASYYVGERSGQQLLNGWQFRAGSSGSVPFKKFTAVSFSEYFTGFPISTTYPMDKSTDDLVPSSTMTVPVQWQRYGDNEVLQTSFTIQVQVSY